MTTVKCRLGYGLDLAVLPANEVVEDGLRLGVSVLAGVVDNRSCSTGASIAHALPRLERLAWLG